MTFKQTVKYLNSLNRLGSVLGLDNMRQLLCLLDNPHDKLKKIHVTGTNGKGSVCAYLAQILKAAGLKVGVYNSPAVICEYDQYKIDCEIISEGEFADAVTQVKKACDELNKKEIYPTRFEVETAAAFVLFVNAGVDMAIIETGLGGKDDATAVISDAILHIITSISEDHIPVLGQNITEIAENKSHIIKTDAPTVAYFSDSDTFKVIEKRCEKYGSPLYAVRESDVSDVNFGATRLTGAYQSLNAAIAIQAAYVLKDLACKTIDTDIIKSLGCNITDGAILKGIKNAYIPFRFEKLCGDPVIIADGAHNPDGAKRLMESLEKFYGGYEYIFVTGMFKDKDCEKICKITGNIAKTVIAVCNDSSERSLDANALANILKKYNDNVSVCDTIEKGIALATDIAKKNNESIIVLFGSLSWLNRARQYINITLLSNNKKPV